MWQKEATVDKYSPVKFEWFFFIYIMVIHYYPDPWVKTSIISIHLEIRVEIFNLDILHERFTMELLLDLNARFHPWSPEIL